MNDTRPSSLSRLFSLWFGFREPVRRLPYAASGFGLMAFKYLLDSSLSYLVTGVFWTPWQYLDPTLVLRSREAPGVYDGLLLWVILCLSIPFVWIGASMTIRRAADAGETPLLGLFFFAPFVNYVVMGLLCLLPTSERPRARPAPPGSLARPGPELLRASFAGAAVGLGMVAVSALLLTTYGLALFIGTPFAMGFVAAYLYGRRQDRSANATLGAVLLSLALAGGALLLFALEGAICLAMAAPPAAALAILGGMIGRALAASARARPATLAVLLLVLPLGAGTESVVSKPRERTVTTVIEIDAPPAAVWPNVVAFSELPPPRRLLFKTGIAYPIRARIEGHGVGAVRYCEFSTGAFVEPITVWDAPSRLAFDVVSQPKPMSELSPYERVHAPHLVESLKVLRGEFRLEELPGGRTRLVGDTRYALDLFPQAYWTAWSDAIIHRIHLRVLEHIERLTLDDPSPAPLRQSNSRVLK